MVKRAKSIRTYIKGKLYAPKYISAELTTLLIIHSIFLLGIGISNIFINIFLLKINNDIGTVVLLNAIHFTSSSFIFMFAGKFAKQISLTFNLRLGIVIYSILFIILLLVQENAYKYVWLIGIMLSLAGGFYYIGYNVLGYDFSNDSNRDLVMGIQGIVITAITMIAPFMASIIIQLFEGIRGYILIFSMSLTLFITAMVLSTKISKTTTSKDYDLKSMFTMPFKVLNWRYAALGEGFRGFREGVMTFLLVSLLFIEVSNRTNSELMIGYYTLLTSTIQLISFYLIAQRIKPYNRKKYILIGAIFISLISSVFLYKINILTIYIYGIIASFFITYINNPTAALFYLVIHNTPDSQRRRIEGMVARETYLNTGRAIGVILFLIIPKSIKIISLAIFMLSLSQILVWYLFNKVEN